MSASKKSFDSTVTSTESVAPSCVTDMTQKTGHTTETRGSDILGVKPPPQKESRLKTLSQKLFKSNKDNVKTAKDHSINYESSAAYLSLR
ncbi:hypothetical protein JCM33374_g1661 [Metschnikowia sp. JCM 33374]|nr:hypothetical protein JCM33374_g1661 [Metschnikowia sp. JCM 33374]